MQIVMGHDKWILYKMCNGRNRGASEMNHQQPYQSLVFLQKGDVVYLMRLKGSSLL